MLISHEYSCRVFLGSNFLDSFSNIPNFSSWPPWQQRSPVPTPMAPWRMPSLQIEISRITCSSRYRLKLLIEVILRARRKVNFANTALVGGIYSVIKSKAPVTTAEYGDRYTLIGPLNRASVSQVFSREEQR